MVKINSFNISNIQQMEGMEGYILRCDVKVGSVKIGSYFDPGDGSMPMFNAEPGYSSEKIEKTIASWGQYLDNKYFDGSPMNWDMDSLVGEILSRQDIEKLIRPILRDKTGCVIGETLNGVSWYAMARYGRESNEDLKERFIACMAKDKTPLKTESVRCIDDVKELSIADRSYKASDFKA